MLGCWDRKRCWNAGMLGCWDAGMLGGSQRSEVRGQEEKDRDSSLGDSLRMTKESMWRIYV